jgi:hypothetical protein
MPPSRNFVAHPRRSFSARNLGEIIICQLAVDAVLHFCGTPFAYRQRHDIANLAIRRPGLADAGSAYEVSFPSSSRGCSIVRSSRPRAEIIVIPPQHGPHIRQSEIRFGDQLVVDEFNSVDLLEFTPDHFSELQDPGFRSCLRQELFSCCETHNDAIPVPCSNLLRRVNPQEYPRDQTAIALKGRLDSSHRSCRDCQSLIEGVREGTAQITIGGPPDDRPNEVLSQIQFTGYMTQETPARNAAPLVHPDLIAPIRYRELQATWILGVKQIAVRVINRPGDMQFNVRLCGIIVMQDVAILRE